MKPLVTLTSIVAPLLRDNVDTDAIIPAAYMRSLATDPATGLFARWRYRPDGTDDPAFVLNQPRFRGAQIVLSGANFGCGSSRENAVWALQGFGIRCVIALGFSDIFRENAFKNALLPIRLAPHDHAVVMAAVLDAVPIVTIDVRTRSVTTASGETVGFDLDPRRQAALLAGADEIEGTLARSEAIAAFRERHRARAPWLYELPADVHAAGGPTPGDHGEAACSDRP